ncbi:MAG: hypothetical protein KDB03_23770 [Planctomycetales bacterium]|nr:hypothetical protein [Planctomycetales bacterium]
MNLATGGELCLGQFARILQTIVCWLPSVGLLGLVVGCSQRSPESQPPPTIPQSQPSLQPQLPSVVVPAAAANLSSHTA